MRNSAAYRKRNTSYQPTRPTPIPIGERRKPQPHGAPGYLRIDTVHQGDQDGRKGLYHINAVDEVTQWEIVAATPQISELWLMPVLEAMLEQFPFVIRGFHSDNGSEFINYNVARLLGKLLIEQTKSRAHHCGDNGLVESKNGAIIRKHIGFGHIDAQHAEAVDQFHRQHLNPYVNFHRPCAVPKIITEANGKRRRVYLRWATPFEMFRETPHCESFLRPGVTLAELERFAQSQSDTEAALAMQRAKRQLLARIGKTQRLSRWRPAHPGTRSAVEMTGGGQRWKTAIADAMGARAGFPPLPTALGKRSAFPTFPQRRRRLFFSLKPKHERIPCRPAYLSSGSSFNENMLRSKPVGAFHMGPIGSNVVKMAKKTQHS